MDVILDAALALAASPWIYAIVFAFAALDGVFPPVPSETVIVGAAALSASTGSPDWILIAFAAAAGAFTGDNLTYLVGRAAGRRQFRWMRGRRAQAALASAARGFERGGASAIFVARYIPVGRVAVNLTAGAVGYPRRRFIMLSLAAGIAWSLYSVVVGAFAGRLFGDNPILGMIVGVVLAIAIGIAVDRVLSVLRRRRQRATSGPEREGSDEQYRDTADSREEDRVATEHVADAITLGNVEDVLGGGERGEHDDHQQRMRVQIEQEPADEVCR